MHDRDARAVYLYPRTANHAAAESRAFVVCTYGDVLCELLGLVKEESGFTRDRHFILFIIQQLTSTNIFIFMTHVAVGCFLFDIGYKEFIKRCEDHASREFCSYTVLLQLLLYRTHDSI